ncbi:MAG: hypothetical protein JNL11_02335 [Bdellovibrionaceae bacterium]|nr:hypothetical protein [Pseudobdellovibrionaceae bacterium]
MKCIFLILVLISFLVGCQNSSSSNNSDPLSPAIVLDTHDLKWESTELSDLSNRPVVSVANKDDHIVAVMKDSTGKIDVKIFNLKGDIVSVEENPSMSMSMSIGSIRLDKSVNTRFAKMREKVIRSQEIGSNCCRYTRFSQAVKDDKYETRGPVLLRLHGPWASAHLGFEVAMALKSDTGEFLSFVVIDNNQLSDKSSFFSLVDELVLWGPKGKAVRLFSRWISECEGAYTRLSRRSQTYKINELDRKDKDASRIVDLDIDIQVFSGKHFYSVEEITLNELENEENK